MGLIWIITSTKSSPTGKRDRENSEGRSHHEGTKVVKGRFAGESLLSSRLRGSFSGLAQKVAGRCFGSPFLALPGRAALAYFRDALYACAPP
jgi:hypothetical protein